jgi:hypothetical protein
VVEIGYMTLSSENIKERNHFENLGLNLRIILKFPRQTYDGTGENCTTWSFIICTPRKIFFR